LKKNWAGENNMPSKEERASHLQNLIEQAFEIIQDLEQSLLVSEEPVERRRWKMQIKERRVEISEWETELEQLKTTTTITTTTITIKPDTPAAPVVEKAAGTPSVEPSPVPVQAPEPPPVPVQVEPPVVEKKVEEKTTSDQPQPHFAPAPVEATLLYTLQGHTKEVTGLDFSSDGTLLATASDDNNIRLWEVASGKSMRTLDLNKEFDGGPQDVKFVPKSPLVAGITQTQLWVWNALTGVKQKALKVQSNIFNSLENLAFSSDGTLVAVSVSNGSTQVWNVADWSLLHTVKNKAFMVMGGSLAFSPDGQVLATTSLNSAKIWLWRVSDGALLHTLEGDSGNITSVAISPDSSLLVAASEDKNVQLWRISDGTLQFVIQAHNQPVRSVAVSPNGAVLASGSDDKTVKLWRISDGTQLANLEGHTGGVNWVAFSSDNAFIASGADDKTARLWQLQWN
jgi:WD40 repeat protein